MQSALPMFVARLVSFPPDAERDANVCGALSIIPSAAKAALIPIYGGTEVPPLQNKTLPKPDAFKARHLFRGSLGEVRKGEWIGEIMYWLAGDYCLGGWGVHHFLERYLELCHVGGCPHGDANRVRPDRPGTSDGNILRLHSRDH